MNRKGFVKTSNEVGKMGEGNGGQFITLYEAEKMTLKMLGDYERDVVSPRHRETQDGQTAIKKDVAEVKELIQQGTGAVKLAGILGSLASVLWIVLQIKAAMSH